jgi:hypothetical protein
MGFLHRLERTFGRFAIPNLSLYLVIGQVFVFLLYVLERDLSERMVLHGAQVMNGEVWRLFTFVFVPDILTRKVGLIFAVFGWYLFYLMGGALEHFWGTFRYNCFILVGWALTVLVTFVFPLDPAQTIFVAGCVFLAFAYLNPNFELLLFFILPVKIKWLALIMWLKFGYMFVVGNMAERFMILAAVSNFFLFFTGEIMQRTQAGRRRSEYQAKQTAERESVEPRHTCVVCGKNDRTHPREDFRYSDDDKCYCSEHRPGVSPKA